MDPALLAWLLGPRAAEAIAKAFGSSWFTEESRLIFKPPAPLLDLVESAELVAVRDAVRRDNYAGALIALACLPQINPGDIGAIFSFAGAFRGGYVRTEDPARMYAAIRRQVEDFYELEPLWSDITAIGMWLWDYGLERLLEDRSFAEWIACVSMIWWPTLKTNGPIQPGEWIPRTWKAFRESNLDPYFRAQAWAAGDVPQADDITQRIYGVGLDLLDYLQPFSCLRESSTSFSTFAYTAYKSPPALSGTPMGKPVEPWKAQMVLERIACALRSDRYVLEIGYHDLLLREGQQPGGHELLRRFEVIYDNREATRARNTQQAAEGRAERGTASNVSMPFWWLKVIPEPSSLEGGAEPSDQWVALELGLGEVDPDALFTERSENLVYELRNYGPTEPRPASDPLQVDYDEDIASVLFHDVFAIKRPTRYAQRICHSVVIAR